MFLPQVLDFVDEHGNEVLNLGSFALLPQHVVRLILARDLKADEFSKFQVTVFYPAGELYFFKNNLRHRRPFDLLAKVKGLGGHGFDPSNHQFVFSKTLFHRPLK